MIRVRKYFFKIINRHLENKIDGSIEYNPRNIDNVLKEFDELNQYVNNLENSLKVAENKTNVYQDLISKYEKILKEELALYKLHKSNISIAKQTIKENEIFINEIQEHIQSLLDAEYKSAEIETKSIPFKRIFSRFFHQNKLCKYQLQQKLDELNETIEQKNHLLDRIHGEIQTWFNHNDSSLPSTKPISLKQAYG